MPEPQERHRRLIRALMEWASASPRGVRGGGGDVFPHIVLHHRPEPGAPETQVRFVATDIDGTPMIRVELVPDEPAGSPAPGGMTIYLRDLSQAPSESPREPTAACEACGTIGTVGWIAMEPADGGEPERHRYCARCWGPEAAWHQARYDEAQRQARDEWLRSDGQVRHLPVGRFSMHAATWHVILEQVREIERTMHPMVPPAREDLAQLAAAWASAAAELEGPMPVEVAYFIQQYGRAAG